jgi:hypothetical protein
MSTESRNRRLAVALAAALGAAIATAAEAQQLGRLFLTPQERQELDRKRAVSGVATAAPQEEAVTVNGVVRRSSGKTTTWINGVPHDDAHRPSPTGRIALESGTTTVGVKVGQTLDRASGTVTDPLGGGEIRVRPGAPR